MKPSNDSNADIWRAYTNSKADLWNQTFVNGEYIIAYELNPYLHQKLKSMLPKVRFTFRPKSVINSQKSRQ